MRKLLLALLFLIVPQIARSQVTVNGHVLLPSNGSPQTGRICFSLLGYKPAVPKVVSSGIIVSQTNFCIDASKTDGSFSTQLWGNSAITPAGTLWRVDFLVNGQQQSSATYNINHSPFDLDTEAPVVVTPPVSNPSFFGPRAFTCTQGSPATTWTCTHNFGNSQVVAECFDTSAHLLWPDTIVQTDINTTTITFVTPTAGNCQILNGSSLVLTTNLQNNVVQNPSAPQIITGQPLTTQGALFATGNGATGNVAIKNSSSDSVRYVSPNGSDGNDGLSWGTAKLTPLSAVTAATVGGTTGGTVWFACGTYPGLPAVNWTQELNLRSACGAPLGALCGLAYCGPNINAGVIFQYASGLAVGPSSGVLVNILLDGIVFDFQNLGGGLTIRSVASFDWRDFAVYRCGNTTTDCLVLTTGTQNEQSNTFTNYYINPNSSGGQYANCLRLQGTGAVLSGQIVTNNAFYNGNCAGQINNGLDLELNTDSNFFYGYRLFNTLGAPVAGSSAVLINNATPGSDQDAGNGSNIIGVNVGGVFAHFVSMGQTTGPYVMIQTGGPIAVNGLGGHPQYTVQSLPLTAGDAPQYITSGSVNSGRFVSSTGTQLTTGQFSFGGSWGTSPAFNTVTGTDGAFTLTFTSGSGSPGANPTIQLNFADGTWTTPPVCIPIKGDGSAPTTYFWTPTLPGASTFLTLNFVGTPVASTSYAVAVTCIGKPN